MLIVLICTCKGLQKSISELEHGKIKAKALQHFKVDPVLKIDETFKSRLNLCEGGSLEITLTVPLNIKVDKVGWIER